ncbi:MAG: hypothetical protein ACK523_07375 [Pirellulaceae bacterium]
MALGSSLAFWFAGHAQQHLIAEDPPQAKAIYCELPDEGEAPAPLSLEWLQEKPSDTVRAPIWEVSKRGGSVVRGRRGGPVNPLRSSADPALGGADAGPEPIPDLIPQMESLLSLPERTEGSSDASKQAAPFDPSAQSKDQPQGDIAAQTAPSMDPKSRSKDRPTGRPVGSSPAKLDRSGQLATTENDSVSSGLKFPDELPIKPGEMGGSKLQEEPDLGKERSEAEMQLERRETEEALRQLESPSLKLPVPEKVVSPDKGQVERKPPSPQQLAVQGRLRSCMAYYLFRPETTARRSPWAVMHAMLPYGVEGELIVGNQRVNAIGWLCYNGRCRTQSLFIAKSQGFSMAVGPGVQGHEGQFLAMLGQSLVPRTYPIKVQGRSYTIEDLVRYEMAGCREKSELTFKLIGLSHYLPSDYSWKSQDGKTWSISKLVEEELAQPLVGAACGGTHRLMGLSFACKRRQLQGMPLDGQFGRARRYLDDCIDYAFSLQNPDGSFSTEWFETRANKPDMDRKVQTTGHILEWLAYELPEDQMHDPRILKAVQFLLSQIWDRRDHDWAIGPRSHAIRALVLYDQKVFGSEPGKRKEMLAQFLKSSQPTQRR